MRPNLFFKRQILNLFTIGFSGLLIAHGEPIEEIDGKVLLEAESTKSKLGKWKVSDKIKGFSGEGYIEFTGNSPINGKADSPLKYEFKINKGGLYYLYLLCAKETVIIKGEKRTDVANDCYVRVEGDYDEAPEAGDKHGDNAKLKALKEDNKFFGGKDGSFAWSGGNRLDLGGHDNKRKAAYIFKSGETYTLIVSGRSQKFKVDQFMFSTDAKVGGKKRRKKKK